MKVRGEKKCNAMIVLSNFLFCRLSNEPALYRKLAKLDCWNTFFVAQLVRQKGVSEVYQNYSISSKLSVDSSHRV